jgi:hypothetical protein
MKKKVVLSTAAIFIMAVSLGWGQTQPAATPTLTVEVKLCTSIENRMPVGETTTFSTEVGTVCCWCRVSGCQGETTIKHVWYYQGKQMNEVELPVRSVSWRTWSFKSVPASMTGEWSVKVMDQAGNVLKEVTFTVGGTATTPGKVTQ